MATERRIDLQLRLGRHGEAIGDLSELVQTMPLRERFHEQLVLALYRSGRQGRRAAGLRGGPADAGRGARDRARRWTLRDLERRVLQQDPSLDWSPPDDAGSGGRRDRGRRAGGVDTWDDGTSSGPGVAADRTGCAARHGSSTSSNGHRAVTLTGPAGAGKTRLAIEVAARNRRPVCYVDFSPIDDPGPGRPDGAPPPLV